MVAPPGRLAPLVDKLCLCGEPRESTIAAGCQSPSHGPQNADFPANFAPEPGLAFFYMTDDDEKRIAEVESKIEELRPRMEAARRRVVEAAAGALSAYWPEYVSECVQASGDALAKMSKDEVARIKAEVAEVTGEPEHAARDALLQLDWPHERDLDRMVGDESNSSFTDGLRAYEWKAERLGGGPTRAPRQLDGALGRAAAAPSHPLRAAGLSTVKTSVSPGKPPSAYGVQWTDDMFEAIDAYGDFVGELQQLVSDLRWARKSRDQNDAQDTWDSA